MNPDKSCEQYREAIAALVMNELADADEIKQHLKQCDACRRLYQVLVDEESDIQAGFAAVADRIDGLQPVICSRLNEIQTISAAEPSSRFRRFYKGFVTMNRKTRIAAAVLLVIGLGIIVNTFMPHETGNVAFADIIRPILTAKTATYKVTMQFVEGQPAQTIEAMFMEPGRMRMSSPPGMITISDVQQGKVVQLMTAQKKAIVMEMQNSSKDLPEENLFLALRNQIQEGKLMDDQPAEYLGENTIDGQRVIGYHLHKPLMDMTLWADPNTELPVRIESKMGTTTCIMTDIAFNVELDESLFDVTVPEGYALQTMQVDGSEPSESDLINTFRVFTSGMYAVVWEGYFPPTIMPGMMDVINQVRKLKREGKLSESEDQQSCKPDMLTIQKMVQKITRGFMFVNKLPKDSDWHYAGAEVKLGEADKAIFWYRPQGSASYRVIYGDLRVADVHPDDLPTSRNKRSGVQ